MVRNYDPDRAVDPAARDRILRNAMRGPSAGFSQGFEFLVCETPESRERFWATTWPEEVDEALPHLPGMRRAPLLVVALSNKDAYLDRYAEADKGWIDRDESRWPVPYWDIDTASESPRTTMITRRAYFEKCMAAWPAEFAPPTT